MCHIPPSTSLHVHQLLVPDDPAGRGRPLIGNRSLDGHVGIVLTFLSPGLIGLAKTDSPTLAAPPSFCSISATPAASIQPKKWLSHSSPGRWTNRKEVRGSSAAWCGQNW